MLQIRDTQMAALGHALEAQFVTTCAARMRARHHRWRAQPPQAAEDFVRLCMTRAQSVHIVSADDVSAYVDVAAHYDDTFGTERGPQWAVDVLSDLDLQPHERILALRESHARVLPTEAR